MPTATVRIRPEALVTLRALAAEIGAPMAEVLERALEEYRRRRMFAEANEAWAQMRSDADDWAEELAEREAWDATLADGALDAKAAPR